MICTRRACRLKLDKSPLHDGRLKMWDPGRKAVDTTSREGAELFGFKLLTKLSFHSPASTV